jgi:MFS family permease
LSAPAQLSPFKRPEFRRLLAISVTVALGYGMIVPVLPLYAKSFGVGLAAIGLVQFVFGLTRFAFNPVGGVFVDRFGERATTTVGLIIVAASSLAAGASHSYLQLVLARGFGGAGSAFFINGLMSRILRIIEPEAMGRATGAFRSSFLVGIGAGPVLGGLLSAWLGLSAPFYFYGFGLLVATAIAFAVMRGEVIERAEGRRSALDALRAARPLMRDLRYLTALLATFVGWWTIAGPVQTVGVVFAGDRLDLSKPQIGIALTLVSVGELLILFVAGRAADTIGRRAVLVPALVVSAVATAFIGQISSSQWALYLLFLVVGATIGAGAVAAGGLLADSIPSGGSGAAVGLNQMAGDLGYLISPTAVAWLAETTSFSTAYLAAAIPAVVVLGVALRLPRRKGSRRQPAPPIQPAAPLA